LFIHLGKDSTEFSSFYPDEVWRVSCDVKIESNGIEKEQEKSMPHIADGYT